MGSFIAWLRVGRVSFVREREMERCGALLFFAAYLLAANGRWMFLAAGLLLLAGIVVTLVVEVPTNKR